MLFHDLISSLQVNLLHLRPGYLLTVCDYQMNGSVLHVNSTTSSKMGANTTQFAIYPVYLVLCLPDGTLVRGGMVFLSRDLKHDRHQVEVFNKRLIEFLKEKYGVDFVALFRYTDQCAQQFKSQFTIYELIFMLLGIWILWVFYEVGEGKNLSDMLGSLFKLAYERAVACSNPTSASAQTIQEIVTMTRVKLAKSTNKFDFIELEEVLPFERPRLEDEKGVVVKAMQKQHHFTRTSSGELVTREISCTVAAVELCPTCDVLDRVPQKVVARRMLRDQGEELDNPEIEAVGADEGDAGASDVSDGEEDGGQEEEEDELGPGSVVWARVQRYHPAMVLAPSDVPASLGHLLAKAKQPSIFIKRFIIEDIKLVPVSRVAALGSNKLDRERAEKTQDTKDAYAMALAVLRGDV